MGKDVVGLNSNVSQFHLIGTDRRLHPTVEHTLINSHGTFAETDHIWATKHTSRNSKEQKSCKVWLSDQNEIKLEINYRKTAGKSPTTWRLKSTLLNSKWITEVSREIKYFELTENQNTTYEIAWDTWKAALRGKFTVRNACIKKDEGSKIELPL